MNFDIALRDLQEFTLEGDYHARLRQLTDAVLESSRKDEALLPMFGILRRFPEEEFGAPGPLVHAIEKCAGYEEELFRAAAEVPSTTIVWMLRRLHGSATNPALREACLVLLQQISLQESINEQVREDAAIVLKWLK